MNIRREGVLDSEFIFEFTKKKKAYLGLRFINFLIDTLSCIILATCLGIIVGASTGDGYLFLQGGSDSALFLDYLIFITIYLFYYSSEFLFEGKTFGKFLTRTRAIHRVNRELDFTSFLLRTLWRFIPINLITFLPFINERWHDHYSRTIVVCD